MKRIFHERRMYDDNDLGVFPAGDCEQVSPLKQMELR